MNTIHGHAMPAPDAAGNVPRCAGHEAIGPSGLRRTFTHRVTVCGRCVADDAHVTLGSLSCGKCKVILSGPASQGVRW